MEWITDRLPENNTPVLVTTIIEGREVLFAEYRNGKWYQYIDGQYYEVAPVTAWMDIPKPYCWDNDFEEYEETDEDREAIGRILAEYEAQNKTYYCAVCRVVPVDAFNGYDTCPDCASKI